MIADLNETSGAKVAATDPDKFVFHKANVATQEAWEQLVQVAEEKFGHIDIVVNNAGTSYANKPTLDVSEAEYDMTMDVNVKSIFWSIKVCVPAMLKTGRGGNFVNVASIGATRPRPGLVWYAASKGTVANVSTVLSLYVLYRGLTSLSPGYKGSGCRVCADGHSSQLCLSLDGSHWPVGEVYRYARHAGEPPKVHQRCAYGPSNGSDGCCEGNFVPRQ